MIESLTGQHVLILGAAGGGRDIALRYARLGATVIAADIDAQGLTRLAAEAEGVTAGEVWPVSADATCPDSIQAMIERVKARWGHLDHLISVVGGARYDEWRGIEDCTLESIELTTRLNLLSHQYLIRFAKPLLVASPGTNRSIVLMGSINALRSFDLPSYSAAKAGMIGLMYGLGRELTLTHRIRINVLLPGTMLSPRTAKLPRDVERLMAASLLGEPPTPEEVTEAVLMFTHRLPHCTQQTLVLDSGQVAYAPPHNQLFP